MHTLQWFINRIGRKIYRKPIEWCTSKCHECTGTEVFVYDIQHAEYLYDAQGELEIKYQGKPL